MENEYWKLKLVEKLPSFDLEWSDEIKNRWFDVVARLLETPAAPLVVTQ